MKDDKDFDVLWEANSIASETSPPDPEFMLAFYKTLLQLPGPNDKSPTSWRTLTESCGFLAEDDMDDWPSAHKSTALANITLALLIGLELGKQGYELP
jgi:hypothetical protein